MKKRFLCMMLSALILFGAVFANAQTARAAELKTSEQCIALIKEYEGFSAKPYSDHGQYSVGYGTRCPADKLEYYKANGITEAEADALLRSAIAGFEEDVDAFVKSNKLTLSQQQYDALICFTYNIGGNWMSNDSTLRKAIISGATGNDLLFAFTQWSSVTEGGVKVTKDHLARRRMAEANIYMNGVYAKEPPVNYKYVLFDNTDCTVAVKIQGYDANLVDYIRSIPTKTGHRFLGWYTAAEGGEWVSELSAATAATKLFAHWQAEGAASANAVAAKYDRITSAKVQLLDAPGGNAVGELEAGKTVSIAADYLDANGVKWGKTGDGKWLALTNTTSPGAASSGAKPVNVVVTTDGVNVRTGPGTNYAKCGTVNKDQQLSITSVQQGGRYRWGQFAGGWICLDYTNYDIVIAESAPDANKVTAIGVVVNAPKVNVRDMPGVNGTKVVGEYAMGDVVEITLQTKVGDTTWGKTPKGWISFYYLQIASTDDSGNSETPSQKPGSPIATGTVVNCTTLQVRAGAGTSFGKTGALNLGDEVKIYELLPVGSQMWGRIDNGWVSMLYIEYDISAQDAKNAAKGKAYNCPTGLRVRVGPGTNFERVCKLEEGAKVEVYELTTVKDKLWGRTVQGWVCMDYVKLDAGSKLPPINPNPGSGSSGGTTPSEPTPSEPAPSEPTPDKPADGPAVESTAMYRMYNPNTGEHFYTGSKDEMADLVLAGWDYEGVAWNAPTKEGEPVFRLYNPNNGDHHYTMSADERDDLVKLGWKYEGVAWNSAAVGNVAQFRLYNPNAQTGSHHYTSSTKERDDLVAVGWKLEGIGWYGLLK